MFKKVVTVTGLVAMLAASVFGQTYNARIQSLGGTFIVGDIYDVLRMPGFVNDYTDDIQATFDSTVIGIKALGPLTIGGVFNTQTVMLSGFNADGIREDNRLIAISPRLNSIQRAPHLLIGFNLDALKLGFDGYWEQTSSSYFSESLNNLAPLSVKTEAHRSVSNPGFKAGVNINTGAVQLAFMAGIGFPTITATQKITIDGVVATDNKTLSDDYLAITAGGEVAVPINQFQFKLGAIWSMENYQFKTENTAGAVTTTTKDTIYFLNTVSPYLGFKTMLPENIMLAMQDYSNLSFANFKNDATDNPTTTINLANSISMGLEKSFPKILFLDSLGLRGGLSLPTTSSWVVSKTVAGTQTTNTLTTNETNWGRLGTYIGLGGSFGPLTCDLALNPAIWPVAIGGPAVSKFTATLNF